MQGEKTNAHQSSNIQEEHQKQAIMDPSSYRVARAIKDTTNQKINTDCRIQYKNISDAPLVPTEIKGIIWP